MNVQTMLQPPSRGRVITLLLIVLAFGLTSSGTAAFASPPQASSAKATQASPGYLTLKQLIETAAMEHPAVASAADLSGARWQFYPTPSVSVENARAESNDRFYQGDSTVSILRLQQPLWTGGRLSAGVDKGEANLRLSQAALAESREQQALYEQRRLGLQQELSALNETLQSAREELQLNEKLLAAGDSSQLEVMRARRQVTEIEARVNAARNKFQQEARLEAVKLSEEQSANRYRIDERSTYLGHTELLSPVNGIIKTLKVTTLGGVLRPGDELLQISPTEGDMVIDIRISPVDIGDLRTGLPVSVKLDAFDYSIYGSLEGVLSHISADTLVEQGANGAPVTYYRGQVKLSADAARRNPKLAAVTLKPGMTASIDILTGRRTILQYLAKPVFRAFGGAMTER